MRKLSVFLKGLGAEIYVSARLVCMTFFDKRADYVDDLLNIFGCARMYSRGSNAESAGIFKVFGNVFVGNLLNSRTLFICALYHLVVNIGEILYEFDVVASVFEVSAKHIEYDEATRISYVKEVINGRTAGVDFDA